MDQFLVSARKYRPASFSKVVGQEHITETLLNEIKQNRLAQSFLFTGPRGVGKTTCARILARVVNTESDPTIDPNYDFAFNIFEMDAASNNSVDDIRQLVEQVRIPPQVGKYKVYIIDEVHMLSSNAFNAFLKTLEEPPPYAIFILATTERHKILPTILSRCQIFNFKRIEPADIVNQLKTICQSESIEADEQALHVIAIKADGGLRDALSMFDQMVSFSVDKKLTYQNVIENLNVLDYNYYFKVAEALNKANYAEVLITFDEVLKNGFDGQYFLNGLASHFRDLLVVKNTATAYLIAGSEKMLPIYKAQGDKLSAGFLLNAINLADEFDQSYKNSRNQRLHVELALIKMANINSAINLAEELKKKSLELATPSAEIIQQVSAPQSGPKPSSDSASKPQSTVRLGNLAKMVNDPQSYQSKKAEDISQKIETESDDNIMPAVSEPSAQFTLKEMVLAFAEIKKKESKPFAYALLKELEVQDEDGKLIITLTNNRDQTQFDELKTDFLKYINQQTGKSYAIDIKIEKVAQKLLKVYTNKDKFNYLAEQYPYLIEFSKELGLELE